MSDYGMSDYREGHCKITINDPDLQIMNKLKKLENRVMAIERGLSEIRNSLDGTEQSVRSLMVRHAVCK